MQEEEEEGQAPGAVAIFAEQEDQSEDELDENPSEQKHKCTESVNKLKAHLWGLLKDVALIGQDL